MRTRISIVLAAGLIASLAACSSPAPVEEETSADCKVTAAGEASKSVTVTGEFGEKPKVEIDTPLSAKKTERSVLVAGDGERAEAGRHVGVQFTILNATNGEELSEYTEGTKQYFPLDEQQFLVGLVKTLECSTVGSRLVGVIPPADSWQSAGSAELGVAPTDSIVFVADIVELVPTRAEGEDQPVEEGFPTVKLAKDGAPTVTVPKTKPSKDLQSTVLKKGDGEVVKDGGTVIAQYQGVNYRTGKVFDQSWGRGLATFQTGGVVKGFADAMIGQTVGSQVLVVIPPALGYGPSGRNPDAGIEEDDTIVFVIDVLATT